MNKASRRPALGRSAPAPMPRPDAVNDAGVDAEALAAELRLRVRGDVRFDAGSRALYSTDASNYRQIPAGVVLPRDAEDVAQTLAACRKYGAPILSRGAGTDLSGSACNAAVVMDFSRYMTRVLEIDWENRLARVEPGCILDDLRNAAEARHYTFGPDPATHNRNTLGGMIGNNSCGIHAQMAGTVEENTEELDVLTYDGLRLRTGRTGDEELGRIIAGGGRRGEIYAGLKALRDDYAELIRRRFPGIPRRISGFALNQLLPENGFHVARALVGTEGTCVTVVEATLRLVPSPPYRTLAVLGFPDIFAAGDAVAFCNTHSPIALEGLDAGIFTNLQAKKLDTGSRALFPDGGAWLIVEFGGESHEDADRRATGLIEALLARPHPPAMRLVNAENEKRQLWGVRENGLGATSKIPGRPDFYPGWEDAAVSPDRLGEYLRQFSALMHKYGYTTTLYGHFGHGCVHCNIDFDLFTAEGIARYRRFVTEAAQLVVRFGGSLSGEHGDGQARGELLPIMYGDELVGAFARFKKIWDPLNKMNPGKCVLPYRLDANLRWGPGYKPWNPPTRFAFQDDGGSFARAANRCVGTGKCRKRDEGTMCPSYMATLEEKDSTRGRARLLFEMLEGDPLDGGWRNEAVKDALDLCLMCKGCKSECPVNVDMATYKAEFLSHYYEERRRPAAAYAFGLMHRWAGIASLAPGLANFVTQTRGLRKTVKWITKIAPERQIPRFAATTFRHRFSARRPRESGRPPVILWPDTWNNYFHPATLQAAVAVLEQAGFQVTIPRARLCCGRPLYDYGMLDPARKMLRQVLDLLRPQIRAGSYLVGLEPSCISVFRDEVAGLLHGDHDARLLSERTFLLAEFLAKIAPGYQPPRLTGRAIVHQHCHHKSVLDASAEKRLLDATGLDYELLDSGCCGMAGAFGFEKRHYEVSMKIGERVLLPKVRAADGDTLIIADGFSCREQIRQSTHREALHLAEVFQMAGACYSPPR